MSTGLPPTEIMRRFSSRDIADLVALDQVEPPAYVVAAYEGAYTRLVLAMTNWDGKGHRPKLKDFLLKWGEPEKPKQTSNEFMSIIRQMAAAGIGTFKYTPNEEEPVE